MTQVACAGCGSYPQFENNCFTEMCSGSEEGSYLRLIDFVYHSTLGLRVIKKKKKRCGSYPLSSEYGTYKTVKARFWPWLSGKCPQNLSSCSVLLDSGNPKHDAGAVLGGVKVNPRPENHGSGLDVRVGGLRPHPQARNPTLSFWAADGSFLKCHVSIGLVGCRVRARGAARGGRARGGVGGPTPTPYRTTSLIRNHSLQDYLAHKKQRHPRTIQ